MADELADLIKSVGPAYSPQHLQVGGGEGSLVATTMTDGTNTVVQLSLYGVPLATGMARRRKGDKHNPDLGLALALTRAFTEAAGKYAQTVKRHLDGEVDPSADAVRESRRVIRKMRAEMKDSRRAAAREAHRRAYGWDHTTYVARKAEEAEWERALREATERRSR